MLWDWKQGLRFEAPPVYNVIQCVAISPDQMVVAWGAWDATVTLWNRAAGRHAVFALLGGALTRGTPRTNVVAAFAMLDGDNAILKRTLTWLVRNEEW